MSDFSGSRGSALAADHDVRRHLAAGVRGGLSGGDSDREDGDDSGNGEALGSTHFYLPGKEILQISKNECKDSDRSGDAKCSKNSLKEQENPRSGRSG